MIGHKRASLPLAFRVQKYLRGLRYPARTAQVIDYARGRGIEQDAALMQALLGLREQEFVNPIALARAFGTGAHANCVEGRGYEEDRNAPASR